MSTKPQPYKHDWKPGVPYNRIYTGWTYPPKDYDKWRELVSEWVRHSIARYGKAEVESWYWEVWNEPDIGYWSGTPEEFRKLYDYAADGVKRVLPTARVGGPHTTGPNGPRAQQLLRDFLEHCLRGTNYATGKIGSPLDFVAFHAKGAPRVVDGHVRMGISNQLRAISNGFQIVASFPELKTTPIVIGESDPEGCAACSMATNPENAYRNGTMYSSYTAAQLARTYELADLHGVNLLGSVTWAFEFEDQPYFAGFRDLATNGIDKPVLNVFRMLGMMRGERLAVTSSSAATTEAIRDNGVREAPDVNALAVRDGRKLAILLWNYHDDDLPAAPAQVEIAVANAQNGQATLTHYRIDGERSNSYAAWQKMGSPAAPTAGAAARAGIGRPAATARIAEARARGRRPRHADGAAAAARRLTAHADVLVDGARGTLGPGRHARRLGRIPLALVARHDGRGRHHHHVSAVPRQLRPEERPDPAGMARRRRRRRADPPRRRRQGSGVPATRRRPRPDAAARRRSRGCAGCTRRAGSRRSPRLRRARTSA